MHNSGLRTIEGVNILPMDGLWNSLEGVAADKKISAALEYAGCEFYDDDRVFVASNIVAITGIGGLPVAHEADSNEVIKTRLHASIEGSRETMGTAAGFSYLNKSEKSIGELYDLVTSLGHFSIAHTVQLNIIIAGISEGAELELSLQRDLVHLSKLTNARTPVQNQPPMVVPSQEAADKVSALYRHISQVAGSIRTDTSGDTLEFANSMYPVNKATLLMLSGDLSNFRKLTQLRNDTGKERELREIANGLYEQLGLLWPEIIKDKE